MASTRNLLLQVLCLTLSLLGATTTQARSAPLSSPGAPYVVASSNQRQDQGDAAFHRGQSLMKDALKAAGRQYRGDAFAMHESILLYRKAIPLLESALKASPSDYRRWVTLSMAYGGAQERTQQVQVLTEAVRRFPANVEVATLHASALIAAGDFDGARAAAGHVAELDPKKARALRFIIEQRAAKAAQ